MYNVKENSNIKIATGDTLVVSRMDHLGRNTVQLLELVQQLGVRNIHFIILFLGIDTRTPTGKFFYCYILAFLSIE
ncbi:recombinase family protein [Mesobacillus subterraneus]|uniref:recombinase family protein n=1 Tax=Mesobacillus TaxID=2675231 RepID=UPI003D67ACC4